MLSKQNSFKKQVISIARHNWPAIEKDYVEGVDDGYGNRHFPTQRELSEKYHIDPGQIGRRAKLDQWSIKRQAFNSRIAEKRQAVLAETISEEGLDLNLQVYNTAQTLIERINKYAEENDPGPRELNSLANALKSCQSIVDSSLGENKGTEEVEIKVTVDED